MCQPGPFVKSSENDNLTPMTIDELSQLRIYHGTYRTKLPLIKSSGGLSKMNRNHIHFTCEQYSTCSGIRYNANVLIYINASKCIEHGIVFYKSLNNVILTSGNKDGKLSWGLLIALLTLTVMKSTKSKFRNNLGKKLSNKFEQVGTHDFSLESQL